MSNTAQPAVSIIISAHNAAGTLERCLDSVFMQAGPETEVILVDDGSTDSTRRIASRYSVRIVTLPRNGGSGPARNRGVAAACGAHLFFIDAYVALSEGTLERVLEYGAERPHAAVIGSYDDSPAVRNATSLFKNLAHHYFHQRSGPEVTTFWSGCGIISKDPFHSVGGFDAEIGDVDLGYRLAARGMRVKLDTQLQVKHLKRWTLPLLVRTDLKFRALPRARMVVEYGYFPKGLNFTTDQRAGGLLAILIVVLAASATIMLRCDVVIALAPLLVLASIINSPLYRLFWRKGGIRCWLADCCCNNFITCIHLRAW